MSRIEQNDANEAWLNDLLNQSPQVADGNFSQSVMTRIKLAERRRYWILASAWIVAIGLTIIAFPLDAMTKAWQFIMATIAATFTANKAASPLPSESWSAMVSAEHINQLLQQPSALAAILFIGVITAAFSQWLLRE